MRLAIALILPLLLAPDGEGIEPPPSFETRLRSTIVVGGVKCHLEGLVHTDTSDGGVWTDTIRYRVRVEAPGWTEGEEPSHVFGGCRYPSSGGMTVRPFPDEAEPLGWVLQTGSICGNTHSIRSCFITLRATPGRPPSGWSGNRLDTKEPPVVRRVGDEIELWSIYQDWGASGSTAASIFVPRKHVITSNGYLRSAPLDSNFRSWPDLSYVAHFPSVFVAGLRDLNPELMRQALDELHDPERAASYRAFGLPPDRATLEEVVVTVEGYRKMRDKLDALTGSFGWKPVR